MRHTRIIATLGPATDSDAAVDQLIASGVEVFRLNFSHGSHESHEITYRRVRDAATRAGRVVAVMQDLSGPKMRIGGLAGDRPFELRPGDHLRIVTGDFPGGPGRVSVSYAELAHAVRPADRLLLDDGRIELRVIETDGTEILTEVVHGALLRPHKGVNAPGVQLPASALTAKDVADLRFGLELGVDVVAISFVQTAGDIARARDLMSSLGHGRVPIVAKIERPRAVANIEEILDAADGVMVARGDLGLELPLERVPRVQKEITRAAHVRGVPVIVATQVLESMVHEPRPTRAEVNDAAAAVADGVDAIMLAGETAIGSYPIRAVQTLDVVIREAEKVVQGTGEPPRRDLTGTGHGRALCEAAVTLVASGQTEAIVAVTRGGKTARLLSAFRPRARIFAATHDEAIARRLMLYWGIVPLVVDLAADVNSTNARIEQHLRDKGELPAGAVVVFVSVSPDLTRRDANFLTLQRV